MIHLCNVKYLAKYVITVNIINFAIVPKDSSGGYTISG